MTTAASDPQVVPRPQRRRCAPPTRAWPTPWSLESVLSDDTRRVYGAQWRLFTGWCDEVGLRSLPAEPSPAWTTSWPATILPAGTGACARR